MNKKALLLLGLLASGDACWPTQSNPATFQVTPVGLGSCSQRAMITVSGPRLEEDTPTVTLLPLLGMVPDVSQPIAVPEADVIDTTDKAARQLNQTTLQVSLPRNLSPASYQVRLTIPDKTEAIVAGSFGYSKAAPVGYSPMLPTLSELSLIPVTLDPLPMAPVQAAVWHPQKDSPLELALIGPGPATAGLTYYHTSTPWSAAQVSLERGQQISAVLGGSILTGNLAVIDLLPPNKPGAQALVAGTTRPGAPAVFLDGQPTPKVAAGSGTTPHSVRQLVAGGKFCSDPLAPQVATFAGNGASGMQLHYVGGAALGSVIKETPVVLNTLVNPMPLAVATGWLAENPLYTDTILVVSQDSGKNQSFAIRGGDQPMLEPIPEIDNASVVAIGRLDKQSLVSQVLFGRHGSAGSGSTQDGITLAVSATQELDMKIRFAKFAELTKNPALALAIADYNGDGINDIVYASTDGLHALINQGASPPLLFQDVLIFSAKTTPALPWNPTSIVVTEFAGDLRPEFIITNGATAPGAVPVLFLTSGCPLDL